MSCSRPGRHSRHRVVIVIMLAICVASAATACGSEGRQESGRSQSDSSRVTTDKATIEETLQFGGIVLPASAKILGVQLDKGIDQSYRLAIELGPHAVQTLLSESGFSVPLEPDSGPFMQPLAGFDLEAATVVRSAQDSLSPGDGRSNTIFRRVVVDQSNPTTSVMHVWLFTT